jgi:hypothetical protein
LPTSDELSCSQPATFCVGGLNSLQASPNAASKPALILKSSFRLARWAIRMMSISFSICSILSSGRSIVGPLEGVRAIALCAPPKLFSAPGKKYEQKPHHDLNLPNLKNNSQGSSTRNCTKELQKTATFLLTVKALISVKFYGRRSVNLAYGKSKIEMAMHAAAQEHREN